MSTLVFLPFLLVIDPYFLFYYSCMYSYVYIKFNFISIACFAAGPVMLAASNACATVPENANIILTVDVSADPEPTATWQLNGGDLPAMTTASLK